MYIPFAQLPKDARVWIYQADRSLAPSEEAEILSKSKGFVEQWAAHGSALNCSANIFHQQFLVLAVNETMGQASGCSIDSSVRFIKSLEAEHQINFFDRSKVAFLVDNKIELYPLQEIRSKVADGTIQADSLTFNNLAAHKKELESGWLVPAKESWLRKYF